MNKYRVLFVALLALSSLGCEKESNPGNELARKDEFSVLQHYEYEYRDRQPTERYLIYKGALKSNTDVIGFPLKSGKGYVWIVANPKHVDDVLVMPEGSEFNVSNDDLADIQESVRLSPKVREYLLSKI